MTWLQISFDTSKLNANIVSASLEVIGAICVTLQDTQDEPVLEPGVGETPLWTSTTVSALFEHNTNIEQILVALRKRIAPLPLPHYRISKLEDQQWERVWMDDFHPIKFGNRTWIVPSWEEKFNVENAVCVQLDPGLAFGTGTHPTTNMCLTWLDSAIRPDHTLIDYGCGSGILAIAALRLGANYAWAIDNDPQALIATDSNATNNQVKHKLKILSPHQADSVQADILVANILANPLIELSSTFEKMLTNGGMVVLSGIMDTQVESVANHYSAWCELQPTIHNDGWACLVGKKIQKNP